MAIRPVQIKRGASLRIALQFESEDEWSALFPADYAIGEARFLDPDSGSNQESYYDLEVSIDNLTRCVYVKSETLHWPIATGSFDIKVFSGDLVQTIPELLNIPLEVYDGVTR